MISLKCGIKEKKTHRKMRSDLWLLEMEGGNGGIAERWPKGTTSSYKKNKYEGCNTQHDDSS